MPRKTPPKPPKPAPNKAAPRKPSAKKPAAKKPVVVEAPAPRKRPAKASTPLASYLQAVETGSEAERIAAALTLAGLGPRERSTLGTKLVALGAAAAFPIQLALEKPAPGLGVALLHLLEPFKQARDTALFRALLVDAEEPEVRLAACEALARRKSPAAIPELLRALRDLDPRVAERAREALGAMKRAEITPVLRAFLKGLRDLPPAKRNRTVVIASSLRLAGFDEIGPLLLDALSDADPSIRARAAQGLEHLAESAHATLPRLRGARRDPDEGVRASVERAIEAIEAAK